MNKKHPLKTVNALIFYISIAILLPSCWHRNEFPDDLALQAGIASDPRQVAADEPAFNVTVNDLEYTLTPRFHYDLVGLVVSYQAHDGKFGLHKRWNDHLNVADICVVWRDNARELDLNAFSFWNGQFTCNFETKDSAAWKRFKGNQLSNNHLLTEDDSLRKMIDEVRIGDQVRIQGWLAEYTNNQGFSRGTSRTRDDTGNGACETIYVNDFSILQTMNNGWRTLMNFSLFGVIASAFFWLFAVFKGIF